MIDLEETVKQIQRLEYDIPSLRSLECASETAMEMVEEAMMTYLQSPKGNRGTLDSALRDMEDAMMMYERGLCIMKRLVELMENDVQVIAYPKIEDYDAALANNGVL
jgi:hypothetical protein